MITALIVLAVIAVYGAATAAAVATLARFSGYCKAKRGADRYNNPDFSKWDNRADILDFTASFSILWPLMLALAGPVAFAWWTIDTAHNFYLDQQAKAEVIAARKKELA